MLVKLKDYAKFLSKTRLMMIFVAISVLLAGSILVADAGIGITFSNQTPAKGTITGNPTPDISTEAKVTEGTLTKNDIKVSLDTTSIDPTLTDLSSGRYKISYKPNQKLKDGKYTVTAMVYDSIKAAYESNTWDFTVDAAPNAIDWIPAKDSTVSEANPNISLNIKDITENLNANSIQVKLDGNQVPATFLYKGYWETDYYEETYYVPTSFKEGTISLVTNGLADGIHTVEMNISDIAGNLLTETWSFKVAAAPKFSNILPVDKSELVAVKEFSAKVSDDNNGIDGSSVVLKVNGQIVNHSFDQATGTVKYNYDFPSGAYTVQIQAKDVAGNLGQTTTSFTVDSVGPEIYEVSYFSDGMVITDGKLSISARLRDLVDIKENVVLALDGAPLNAEFLYAGYTDYYGDWEVTSRKEASINYFGVISNGNHTLTLDAEDKLGNKSTYTWYFTASTNPNVSKIGPTGYGINTLTPTIKATINTVNGAIDPEAIVLQLNGETVAHKFNSSTGEVSYTPTDPLVNENYYSVSLIFTEPSGNVTETNWKFYITTYRDMADSNIANCTLCHTQTSSVPNNGPFESIHARNISFNGTHAANDCDDCHTYLSVPAGCVQCHDSGDATFAPHGSTPSIKYNLIKYDQNFPLRVTQNREMWDCVICHQPGSEVYGYDENLPEPSRLLNNHDIPELHKARKENTSCIKCHADSITREHAREGRVDSNNQPITCKTCHASSNSLVIQAIANKDTKCKACHIGDDHETMHVSDLGQECFGCHNNTISTEHVTRGFTCSTCHESTNPRFQQAITWGQRTCSSCHTAGHGLNFATKLPTSIPQYTLTASGDTISWSTPQSLSIWQGEAWVPSDMSNGQLVISERKAGLSANEVFNFYKSKMAEFGWVKVSGPDALGQENIRKFELAYTLTNKKVLIRFYDTENYTSGQVVSKGPRLEILYR